MRVAGKSSLVKRYVDGPTESIEAYHPTIEQTHHKELAFAGRSWKIKIIDTAGQVRRQLETDGTLAQEQRGTRSLELRLLSSEEG